MKRILCFFSVNNFIKSDLCSMQEEGGIMKRILKALGLVLLWFAIPIVFVGFFKFLGTLSDKAGMSLFGIVMFSLFFMLAYSITEK